MALRAFLYLLGIAASFGAYRAAVGLLRAPVSYVGLLPPGGAEVRRGGGRRSPTSISWFGVASQAASLGVVVTAVLAVTFNVEHIGDWYASLNRPGDFKSVAVLPLVQVSGAAGQDHLADGITEGVTRQLGMIKTLRVIAPSSVMRLKSTQETFPRMAKELNVDALIQGTLGLSGDHLTVTTRLVKPGAGLLSWERRQEGELSNAALLETEVARAIALDAGAKVTPQENERLGAQRPVAAEAYLLYLEGRSLWNTRDSEAVGKALKDFQQATQLAPDFAKAYDGIADCFMYFGDFGILPARDSYQKAQIAAEEALRLDETLPDAHASLAAVKQTYEWDWFGAEREFERSIELQPSFAKAHQWYALELAALGRFGEARSEIATAKELDPLSPMVSTHIGWVEYLGRNYERAISEYQESLKSAPDFAPAIWRLGEAYLLEGKYENAIAEFKKARPDPLARALLGYAYAVSGDRQRAREIITEIKRDSEHIPVPSYEETTVYPELGGKKQVFQWPPQPVQTRVPPYELAIVYSGLGDKEHAFQWLRQAADDRWYWIVNLDVEPIFDAIRLDPRFKNLLQQVGLPAKTSRSLSPRGEIRGRACTCLAGGPTAGKSKVAGGAWRCRPRMTWCAPGFLSRTRCVVTFDAGLYDSWAPKAWTS